MATEHERIEQNTLAIAELGQRMDDLARILKGPVQPVFASRTQVPTYSFVFGDRESFQPELVAAFDDDWIPILGCDNFYTAGQTQTVTVDVKNDTPRAVLDVDIGGAVIDTVPVGKKNNNSRHASRCIPSRWSW